jgi:hypothetical protein
MTDKVENEVVDRGDDLEVDTGAAEAAAAAAEAMKAAEDTAVLKDLTEKKEEPAKEEAKDETKDEQQRDDSGKFAPKAIPKARVDEMVGKEKLRADAAERRLAEIEKQVQTVDRTAEITALETENLALDKEHAQATLDGKADRMAEIAALIRKNERAIQASGTQAVSASAMEQMREEIRLDVAIEQLQIEFPSLVEGHENYDQDVLDVILTSQEMYMKRDRMPASQALTLSVQKIMGKLAPAAADDTDETEEAKGLDAAKGKKTDTRKTEAVAKNLEAAKKQPSNMKESGIDSDKAGITSDVDAAKLSTEEFDALPEATKARMRGDTV